MFIVFWLLVLSYSSMKSIFWLYELYTKAHKDYFKASEFYKLAYSVKTEREIDNSLKLATWQAKRLIKKNKYKILIQGLKKELF